MTDWKALAEALRIPLTEQDLDRIVPRLEDLERVFLPLRRPIPHSTLPWTGIE